MANDLRPVVLRDADSGITLVPLTREDGAEMGILAGEPGAPEYTMVPTERGPDFGDTWVGRYVDGWADGTRAGFSIRDDDDAFLGFMALVQLELEQRQGEAGYLLKESARGRGAATIGLRLLTEWGFEELGLERIEMHIDITNQPSLRLADRAGYKREGVLRSMYFKEGTRCDLALYSMVRADRPGPGHNVVG